MSTRSRPCAFHASYRWYGRAQVHSTCRVPVPTILSLRHIRIAYINAGCTTHILHSLPPSELDTSQHHLVEQPTSERHQQYSFPVLATYTACFLESGIIPQILSLSLVNNSSLSLQTSFLMSSKGIAVRALTLLKAILWAIDLMRIISRTPTGQATSTDKLG